MSLGPYEAYVIARKGTPSERHTIVYWGENELMAESCVQAHIEQGDGTYGYVQKNGVTISYQGASSSLRPIE